jgi:transcriptional regulator with XRE-family HTH domain
MTHKVRFDGVLMSADIAAKGWQPADLAERTEVARSSVSRFLSGESQTARMAKKFAQALGQPVRRYVISADGGQEIESATSPVDSAVPGRSDVRQSPPFDRRATAEDRRLGGRRRDNRLSAPDRRKEPRRG